MSKGKLLMVSVVAAIVGGLIGWFVHGMVIAKGMAMAAAMGGMQAPPATVIVQTVEKMPLQEATEYIAQIEPVQDVMIRSEVSGTIETVHFTEGSDVQEGDVLFTIDKRSYQATADAAKAEQLRAQWRYDRLKNADERSVSRSDMESAESDLLRAKAAYDLALVDLERTEIKAPVSGRIGAVLVRKGNVVSPSSDALARIVQIDPIRVTFSLTDREYLKLRQQEIAGDDGARIAQARLPDGTVLPTIGKKDFDDNAINPQTGTLSVRYLFDNPDGLLIPGGYVTALLRSPVAEKGIRIPQKSLLVDQQGTYVLTVDGDGTVGTARITVGLQIGSDVTVLSGLKEGDRIVVEGVQKTRAGATVNVIPAEEK